MNKNIIKKAIIVAILITAFSLLTTKWLDYKKAKDYEAMRQDMIQTTNKPSRDVGLVTLKIKQDTVTKSGLTLVITDHNDPDYGWGPGYEVLKLVNDEQWIPLTSKIPMVFNEIAYVLDVKLEDVLEGNISKLSKRYKNGFTKEESINRK